MAIFGGGVTVLLTTFREEVSKYVFLAACLGGLDRGLGSEACGVRRDSGSEGRGREG